LVFTFYQFNKAPIFFNEIQLKKLENAGYKDSLAITQAVYNVVTKEKQETIAHFSQALNENDKAGADSYRGKLNSLQKTSDSLRKQVVGWITKTGGDKNDTNYIFLRFVI